MADVKKNERIVDDTVPYADLLLQDKEPIGGGSFGAVYVAIHKEWGCKVAYKKLGIQFIGGNSKAEKQLIQTLAYEAEIHRQLRHPNIISMLGIVFESGNYGIILEFVTYGSLRNFLSNLTEENEEMSCVPWILKINLTYEICIGMAYLHNHDILHCDLKLANVLISENVKAKISDFGLSKWKNFTRTSSIAGYIGGTISHFPPEKLSDINYRGDDKCDVYSFSILCWELFTEREAYKDNEVSLIRSWVIIGERLPLNCLPPEVPREVHSLIESCWNQQASNRPSFSVIKNTLTSLVCGTINEKLTKVAKEKVIATLHKFSNSKTFADHVQKLKQFQQQLCEFIRRADQILSSLRERREITQQEYELICSQPTDYKTINLLIDKLCDKSVFVYHTFLDALHNTSQQYLVSLLEDRDYQLNTTHRTVLIDHTTYLKKNIVLSHTSILDHLLQNDVLDHHEVENIASKGTNDEKVHQLLHYILRTSRAQYLLFLESLKKAGHEFVCSKLEESGSSNSQVTSQMRESSARGPITGSPTTTVYCSANSRRTLIYSYPIHRSLQRTSSTSTTITTDSVDSGNVATSEQTTTTENNLQGVETINIPGEITNDIQEIDFMNFLENPTLLHVVSVLCVTEAWISGITVLGGKVFVARASSQVNVYKSDDFTSIRNLTITGSNQLKGIEACSRNNCLYALDRVHKSIYRYDLTNNVTTNWSLDGKCHRLSITDDHNVLASIYFCKRIQEYTTNGELIREISLDNSIDWPRHSVQLSTGNYVLCHHGSQHRVCIVNEKGHIILSYGGSSRASVGQMNGPSHIAVDIHDNVLVTDSDNHRVKLFNPILNYLGDIVIPGHQLNDPCFLHWDELNRRLYIGEWKGRRLFVLGCQN